MERLKTISLTILVLLSLVQSFFLTYSMPNFDGEKRKAGTYLITEPMGPQEKVENLLYPKEIILHMGNNEHTILSPGVIFYSIILNRLQGRSYDSFQMKTATTVDWVALQKSTEGVELKFDNPIPVKLLQKVLPIADDTLFQAESVSKMMIFTAESSKDVMVLFLTADGKRIYESTRADLTIQDVKQQVEFGRNWTPYQLIGDDIYIPKEPLELAEVTLPYTSYSAEQMQRSLFFDPTLTKIIREADGSTIYTDGRRGLQLQSDQKWITYTDATAPTDGRNDTFSAVLESVNFVNNHGGWNGTYRLAETPKDYKKSGPADLSIDPMDQETTLKYQLYWGSYPIVATKDFRFGYVQLKLRQGLVTNYERSLIQLETHAEKRTIRKLIAGETLLQVLRSTNRLSSIVDVEPVYEPKLRDNTIQLMPAWQITYNDGLTELIKSYQ